MKSCLIANLASTSLAGQPVPAEDRFDTLPMIALRPLLARQVACNDRFATLPANALDSAHSVQNKRADRFATEPIASVTSLARGQQIAREEELYTSFEEAISARAARVSRQLSHLPLVTTSRALPSTDALPTSASARRPRLQRFWHQQRRVIVLACLGLGLLLAGFDLMGLLVLVR